LFRFDFEAPDLIDTLLQIQHDGKNAFRTPIVGALRKTINDMNAEIETILTEIFIAYKEAGTVYKKSTDPQIKHVMLAIKHQLDLVIQMLLPIDETRLQSLNDLNVPFSN